jgi:hypothetical protein
MSLTLDLMTSTSEMMAKAISTYQTFVRLYITVPPPTAITPVPVFGRVVIEPNDLPLSFEKAIRREIVFSRT